MITSSAFAGKRYAVLGLARSGLATVEALLASGAEVMAWDEKADARDHLLSSRAKSRGAGTDSEVRPSTSLGTNDALSLGDPLVEPLEGYDGVVVSPGVPLNRHPIAARAREAGVPIIGDIELFALARPSLPPHKVVGITGTNGKSTTTALIHHILKTAGVPTTMGGNIGLPILAQDPLSEGGVYVLELSSYQIDLTYSLDCDVAVLTNVTPDHLDRYVDFAAYERSKARLFELQSESGLVVWDFTQDGVASLEDLFDMEILKQRSKDFKIFPSDKVLPDYLGATLQGPHNRANAKLALSAVWALGYDGDELYDTLRSFSGLPHRMERVAEHSGVLFVNDSKATNATATAPALAAYPLIHWILGGLPKSDDLDDCAPHFNHVKAAYVIGEAGPMFARILREAGVQVTESGTLDQAVRDAAAAAKPGEVVLLSPACASFDQFKDYEARGQAFRDAVGALQ